MLKEGFGNVIVGQRREESAELGGFGHGEVAEEWGLYIYVGGEWKRHASG